MMIISPAIVKHTILGEASNIVSMAMEAALLLIDLDMLIYLELYYNGGLIPPRAEQDRSSSRSSSSTGLDLTVTGKGFKHLLYVDLFITLRSAHC